MRIVFYVLLLSMAGSVLIGCSALNPNRPLKYKDHRPLTWSDFQGEAEAGSRFKALIRSGVRYKYRSSRTIQDLQIDFNVYAYMHPHRSWTRVTVGADYLLAHESLHFKIAELHARRFRKALSEAQFTDNFKAEIKELFKKNSADRNAMQKRYDKESAHSKNREAQKKWEAYVEDELLKLRQFKRRFFSIFQRLEG